MSATYCVEIRETNGSLGLFFFFNLLELEGGTAIGGRHYWSFAADKAAVERI